MENNTQIPAPDQRRVGLRKAYFGQERLIPGNGFCFAESASKAKALIFRSAKDAGFQVRFQDITVRRAPALDGRIPDDYRNQFFTMDHIRHLPLPNQKISGAAAGESK